MENFFKAIEAHVIVSCFLSLYILLLINCIGGIFLSIAKVKK